MTTKREIEVEAFMQTVCRDELPKKYTSSAEGIWANLEIYGHNGGVDVGHGAAQRYAHFGLPHPDAIEAEKVVSALPDQVLDWESEAEDILGPLFALVKDRMPSKDTEKPVQRVSRVGWGQGPFRVHESVEPPRVACEPVLRPGALVMMHAKMGTRPDWFDGWPEPSAVPAARGPHCKIVGECTGKNAYSLGTYCPIEWVPRIWDIIVDRCEYLCRWRALRDLPGMLNRKLSGHFLLPPVAHEFPWRDPEPPTNVIAMPRPPMRTLPLGPQRPTMGPPLHMPKAGKVRSVAP